MRSNLTKIVEVMVLAGGLVALGAGCGGSDASAESSGGGEQTGGGESSCGSGSCGGGGDAGGG